MKIEKILNTIWKEFIYGGHFQSIGSVSIIFISIFFLKVNFYWTPLIVAYFITYPAYLYNRWKEIETDQPTNPTRTAHFKTYYNKMPLILGATILIALALLFYVGNIYFSVLGLFLLVAGLFYTILFKNLTKKIYLFKNFYVALSFSLLIILTTTYYHVPLNKIVGLLMIFVFLKAFIMQILLDLKDAESDRKLGLKTLVVKIDQNKTIFILKILSASITFSFVVIFSLFMPVFPKLILLFLLTIPFNFYCFELAKKRNYTAYILGSGEFILWSILLLITKPLL